MVNCAVIYRKKYNAIKIALMDEMRELPEEPRGQQEIVTSLAGRLCF